MKVFWHPHRGFVELFSPELLLVDNLHDDEIVVASTGVIAFDMWFVFVQLDMDGKSWLKDEAKNRRIKAKEKKCRDKKKGQEAGKEAKIQGEEKKQGIKEMR